MEENKILEILNLRNSLLMEYKKVKKAYNEIDQADILKDVTRSMLILKSKVIAINQVLDILGYAEDNLNLDELLNDLPD